MKVRALTVGVDLSWPLNLETLDRVGDFGRVARQEFLRTGTEVQSVRVACQPFPLIFHWEHPDSALSFAQALERAALDRSIDYVSIGPAVGLPTGPSWEAQEPFVGRLPEVLAGTTRVFSSVVILAGGVMPDFRAVDWAARTILALAPLRDGVANMRFAVLANCSPNIPFFPAAYHGGGPPTLSVALEAADLAVQAIDGASDLEQAEERLVGLVGDALATVSALASPLAARYGMVFGGVDVSLAPSVEMSSSIGAAFERMGAQPFGSPGSVLAVQIVTRALRRVQGPKAGFSGAMLPVLEDPVLAQRMGDGHLGVRDLLLVSAVCGTGLDTVPLPGDVTQREVVGILLDLGAVSSALDKPLTARLIPVPGKGPGDLVQFPLRYTVPTRIPAITGYGPGGLLYPG